MVRKLVSAVVVQQLPDVTNKTVPSRRRMTETECFICQGQETERGKQREDPVLGATALWDREPELQWFGF